MDWNVSRETSLRHIYMDREEVARTPAQMKTTKKGGNVPLGRNGGVEVAVGAVAAPVLLGYGSVDDMVRVEGGL